ncbi:unnamed protein product [Calypogeia fissa]
MFKDGRMVEVTPIILPGFTSFSTRALELLSSSGAGGSFGGNFSGALFVGRVRSGPLGEYRYRRKGGGAGPRQGPRLSVLARRPELAWVAEWGLAHGSLELSGSLVSFGVPDCL